MTRRHPYLMIPRHPIVRTCTGENVLVAYDGSEAVRRALAHAADLARPEDRLTVVNVMPEPGVSARIGAPGEQLRQQQLLDDARRFLAERGLRARALAPVGNAASEILAAAERVDVDVSCSPDDADPRRTSSARTAARSSAQPSATASSCMKATILPAHFPSRPRLLSASRTTPSERLSRLGWTPADAARWPVLFVNPRSGGGAAVRAAVPERARERGIEVVILSAGQSLPALVGEAVAGGADALGMAR